MASRAQPPAGQGFRVAVEDPNPPATNAGGEIAGQVAEAVDQLGELAGGGAQPGHDLIGAVDDVVADVVGVGAAAAGALT
jgi:hypothetical protein